MLKFALLCLCFYLPLAAASLTVNDASDEGAADVSRSPDIHYVGSRRVTLRSAIEYINAQGESANEIGFTIWQIAPQELLPSITVPVDIEGDGVEIVGPGASVPTVATGLTLDVGSDGSKVSGVVINGFIGDGLELFGAAIRIKSSGCQIVANYLGTDVSGTNVLPNLSGVVLEGNNNSVEGNLIAGNLCGMSQFYSGNNFEGNQLLPYPIGAIFISGNNNVVQNNLIGTDVSGKKPLLNDVGIRISGCGNSVNLGNVISATIAAVQIVGIPNSYFGEAIPPGSVAGMNNSIVGNTIGLKEYPVPGIGVHFAYGPQDGITPQNNLIAQNYITGFSKGIQLGAVNTPVLNNSIEGNTITQNSFYGILATNALYTQILDNVISDNGHYGIYLTDEVASNTIQNNLIESNGKDGIKIATPYFCNWWHLPVQQNNTTKIFDNIIVGNSESGIHIAANSTNNIIKNNKIGLTSDDEPFGNGVDGIKIVASGYNLISGNQIAYNGAKGVNADDPTNALLFNQIWGNGRK